MELQVPTVNLHLKVLINDNLNVLSQTVKPLFFFQQVHNGYGFNFLDWHYIADLIIYKALTSANHCHSCKKE